MVSLGHKPVEIMEQKQFSPRRAAAEKANDTFCAAILRRLELYTESANHGLTPEANQMSPSARAEKELLTPYQKTNSQAFYNI